MSWPSGPLLGFDLETTSADPFEARIVSVGFAHFDNGVKTGAAHHLVDPSVLIPAEATAIHGITNAIVAKNGMTLAEGIQLVVGLLERMQDANTPIVGMNIAFDLTIVDCLARSLGGEGLLERGWHGPVIDVCVIDRHVDKWRGGKRRLGDLCTTYGVTLDNAHEAEADTAASVEVLLALVRKYPELAVAELTSLMRDQAIWRRVWHADLSAYFVKHGRRALPPHEGDWPIMRSPGAP